MKYLNPFNEFNQSMSGFGGYIFMENNIIFMKYLKSFKDKFNQRFICKKYGITNYTINNDGSIDVDGNVNLSYNDLTKLPLKFRNVSGNFYCSENQLTTLEGCPKTIGGNFACNSNQLVTLEGGPKTVGGNFYCHYNRLTTLEGGPKTIGGNFHCNKNQLTTFVGFPESLGGYFDCNNNRLTDFIGFPEDFEGYIFLDVNPVREIYDLFRVVKCIKWINEFDVIQGNKVIMDRLEEVYHQLGMVVPENIELTNYEII